MVSFIEIKEEKFKGNFINRPNRFLAQVEIKGKVTPCFLPNPGRMWELLAPGVEVLVRKAKNQNRKTKFDLIGVMHEGELVSLDTMAPNKLIYEALKNKEIEEFKNFDFVKPEQKFESSRFDFFLANGNEKCLLEVKSCSLVEDGVALFPDAPTTRGKRHLLELIQAKKQGYRACVLFVIQRVNAHVFRPNDKTDPDFGDAFRLAVQNGVEAYAYYSEFVGNRITLREKIKIEHR